MASLVNGNYFVFGDIVIRDDVAFCAVTYGNYLIGFFTSSAEFVVVYGSVNSFVVLGIVPENKVVNGYNAFNPCF